MKENKHTPGPWEVSVTPNPQGETIFDVCLANGGDMIVDLKDTDNAEANAQLIASAPELLGALEWFVEFAAQHPEWMESFLAHEDSAEREWFNAARQAIAKAKGGV